MAHLEASSLRSRWKSVRASLVPRCALRVSTTNARLGGPVFHQGGPVAARPVHSDFHPTSPAASHRHFQAFRRFPPGTRSLSPRVSPDAHPSAPVTCKVVPLLHSQPMPALAAFFPGASGPRRCSLALGGLGRRRWALRASPVVFSAVPGLVIVQGFSPPLKAIYRRAAGEGAKVSRYAEEGVDVAAIAAKEE